MRVILGAPELNEDQVVTTLDAGGTAVRESTARRMASTVRSYIALTKPRVIELLLVTTIPTMILAERGLPSWGLMAATLIGGACAAGSANTLNCYLDRDIDKIMVRTKERPLVTGDITPRNALIFGLVLGAVSLVILGAFVTLLAAGLGLAAICFYVFVYTLGLKRRTPSNIVWGGAAGCAPVLIGWAAVTGSLSWAPWVLFGVIFLWTPPHYWPLSMKYADDYNSVDVPMLGAVESATVVGRRIITYTWAMVLCSLLLVPVAAVGLTYTLAAVVLGAVFVVEAYKLNHRARQGVDPKPMRLFGFSITYLTLLFLAIAVDPFVTATPVWEWLSR